MKIIRKHEILISGKWEFENGKIKNDQDSIRIKWLIKNQLKWISKDDTGWINLYQDPNDGRYWELTYEDSHLHGGGPPTLKHISDVEAKACFRIYSI